MPRYFFDYDDGRRIDDHDGIELAGPDEVEKTAGNILTDLARQKVPSALSKPQTVTVRDQSGQPIYSATLTVEAAWKARPTI